MGRKGNKEKIAEEIQEKKPEENDKTNDSRKKKCREV